MSALKAQPTPAGVDRVDVESALEMAAALPPQWMQLARFADVGHGAWRDDPEAAFAVLRRFILE